MMLLTGPHFLMNQFSKTKNKMEYRYLIIINGSVPFLTHWYDFENNYEEGMTVYDFRKMMYTSDGVNWNQIQRDSL